MTDSFEDRLRGAARSAPTPTPPVDLIDRVLAERVAGDRIILPTEGERRRMLSRGFAFGLLLLAAVVVFALVAKPKSVDRADSTAFLLASAEDGLFVSTAHADQRPAAPQAPPLRGMDGSKIVARSYSYRLQFVDTAGHVTPDGGGSMTVTDAGSMSSVPAWRIVLDAHQTEEGQGRTASETLFVTKRTLEPLSRVVHVRPYLRFSSINITQRFTADSVLGEMTSDHGIRRPIAQRLPERFGPFISDAIAPLSLAGVPLSRGWSASLSVIGWAVVARDVFHPATLRVIGEERISTAAGVFDCWKVAVTAGRQRHIEWVRKSDGLGLRSYDEAATPKGHRQYELLNP